MKKVHICYTQNQTLQIFHIRRKILQKLNGFAYVHVKTNIKNQTLQTLRMYIKSFLTSARKNPETNRKNPIQNFYTDEGQRKSNTSPNGQETQTCAEILLTTQARRCRLKKKEKELTQLKK
jgi:hypothetical protein